MPENDYKWDLSFVYKAKEIDSKQSYEVAIKENENWMKFNNISNDKFQNFPKFDDHKNWPDWVQEPNEYADALCAIGVAKVTSDRDKIDSKEIAYQRAIQELSRSIAVKGNFKLVFKNGINEFFMKESLYISKSIYEKVKTFSKLSDIWTSKSNNVYVRVMLERYECDNKYSSVMKSTDQSSRKADKSLISKLKDLQPKSAIACILPFNGIVSDASRFENDTFQLQRERYSARKIQNIVKSVNTCNAKIEVKIKEIKEQISKRISQKSILESSLNIKDMIKRLNTLKREKIKIKESFQEDIQNQDTKGLFAVLVESTDTFSKTDTMINAARHYMGSKAIDLYIGKMLKAKSWLNDDFLQSHISVTSSGVFKIDATIFDDSLKFFNEKTQYVYAAVIRVSPLKKNIRKEITLPSHLENCGVVNLLSDTWQSEFQEVVKQRTNSNYASYVIQSIDSQIIQWKEIVEKHNQHTLDIIKEKNRELNNKLSNKDREILKDGIEIDKSRKQLNKIYKQMGVIQSDEPENQLENGIKVIQSHIDQLYANTIAILQYKMEIRDESVQTTNDPIRETQQKILALYSLMKETHCKAEHYFAETIVENSILTGHNQKGDITMMRTPKKVHVYPYSRAGQLRILLVMQFSIYPVRKSVEESSYDEFKAKFLDEFDEILDSINFSE